jgi:hypothetical protein
MPEVFNSQGMVIVFYLAVILVPQFLYFEISFRARENYKPRMTESLLVGVVVAVGIVVFWLNYGGGGEGGLVFVALSPLFVIAFTIIGLAGGLIYKSRGSSLFKKLFLDEKNI